MLSVSLSNRHPRLRYSAKAVERVFHVLAAHHAELTTGTPAPGSTDAELSVAFLTDEELAQLHADFLDDPTPTDVITFEGEAQFGAAGEICVSVDTAAAYARKEKSDFSRELTLYLVHGWLHLIGYDDLQPAKKRVMRRAEAKALKLLGTAGALPVFKL